MTHEKYENYALRGMLVDMSSCIRIYAGRRLEGMWLLDIEIIGSSGSGYSLQRTESQMEAFL